MKHRIAWQLVGVLGASIVLGFAFNASSPVGVRFGESRIEPLSAAAATITTPTNQSPSPVIAAVTNRLTVLPPSPPPPVNKPAVKPATTPAPTPTPIPPPVQVANARTLLPSPVATPHTPTTPVAATNASPAEPNPAPIHWAQAKPLAAAGQAVLVDVRHKSMFDAGHIPGAISLPETSSPEEFTAFLNNHPTNLTLIVYCSSVSCSQSARVANRLVTQFHRPSVKYMTGGYMEYQQAELSKNPAQPTP